jgi:hypothetical protein
MIATMATTMRRVRDSRSRISRWFAMRKTRQLRPIVIGGCARSGTTLLLSLLSSHRQIAAVPYESQLLCPGAYWPPDGGISKPDIEKLYRELSEFRSYRTCQAWCEKSPRNVSNFEAILASLGSRARLIHIVRDGRDVVLSRHPKNPAEYWVSPQRWLSDVRAGLAFRDHPQVLTIRYEDLVSDLPRWSRCLCEFLSLGFDDRIEQYPRFASVVSSDAWFRKAHAVSAASIGQWNLPANAARVREFLDTPGATTLLKELDYES